jgi:hypothetical protein
LNKNIELSWYQDYKNIKFYLKNDEGIMPKTPQIKLPKQLWNDETIDLRHSYQGKLLNKSEGFKLGKAQRKKFHVNNYHNYLNAQREQRL